MNIHFLEETFPGKLLLLTAKIVMPLLVLALLVVTPTFVPRRLLLNSYLLDLVLRLLAALMLLRAFWLLPDLVQRFDPRAPGWSVRLWLRAARRLNGPEFLIFYVLYTGLITLLVTAVSAWSINAFLPSTGAAGWLLPALFGLQFAALYALQYAPMRQKVTGLAAARYQAPPPASGAGGGRLSQRPRPVPPRSVRGVVIPSRRPADDD